MKTNENAAGTRILATLIENALSAAPGEWVGEGGLYVVVSDTFSLSAFDEAVAFLAAEGRIDRDGRHRIRSRSATPVRP